MSQTSRPLLERAMLTPKSLFSIVGKHCILKWLKPKPDGCHANSCVICRHQFFEPWPAVVQRQYDANYQERDFDATEFVSHLRAVEGAGYSIGHYFGFLSPRDRVVARQQMASNRQQVAVKEEELYFALGVRGVRLPPPLHTDWEVLDHRQDQALFEYIEREGAFRGVSLNEAYRVESMGLDWSCPYKRSNLGEAPWPKHLVGY